MQKSGRSDGKKGRLPPGPASATALPPMERVRARPADSVLLRRRSRRPPYRPRGLLAAAPGRRPLVDVVVVQRTVQKGLADRVPLGVVPKKRSKKWSLVFTVESEDFCDLCSSSVLDLRHQGVLPRLWPTRSFPDPLWTGPRSPSRVSDLSDP